jgi:hypothetical protein
MQIKDFCIDYNDTLWQKLLAIIVDSNDDLKANYIDIKPSDFVCWPVLIDNNEIVCFSGLQQNFDRWGKNFARVNSRFYINPKFRHKGPGKLTKTEKFLNTKYLLPIQIFTANKMNFEGVFMSREGDYRKAFERYSDLAFKNTGIYFEILNDRYNVCGNQDIVPESCKQWIALHCFNGRKDLWENDMKQFKIIN